MKKFIVVGLFACLGCFKEENIDPSTPGTFVKYFNGGFNDVAQDIKQTSDGGFILLATSEIRPNEITAARYKIKLIKTNEFGAVEWQRVYPQFDPDTETETPIDSISFRGRSVIVLKDGAGIDSGYIVVGDSIQKGPTSQSHMRIMQADLEGNITRARNVKPNFAVQGKAVAINANGNFVALGAAVNTQLSNNMFLAEFDQDLNFLWGRTYGAGATNLTNRLFVDAQSSIFWSGTVTKSNRSDIRFTKTPPNSQNTEFDLDIGTPANNETGNDICAYGFGFAVVGTSDESGDDQILFKRLAEDGRELASNTYGFAGQTDTGLSVCAARDGGVILLGSVDTHIQADNTQIGRGGRDYHLIKINAFGEMEWSRIFGSKNDDIGNSVLSIADGSFILFGTTVWGGLRTLSLIKTDNLGNVE